MTDAPLLSATFHTDSGKEWVNDELVYIPRAGDLLYDGGAFLVEEVWEVAETIGPVAYGTHVFVTEVPLEGTRLSQLRRSDVTT